MDMKHPTTEQGDLFGYQPETAVEPGMTRKLSHLRQKLGQKAKQEPQFLFYTLRVERKAPPANAWGESLQESRMRENRTSGSMRGRSFTPPYSTRYRAKSPLEVNGIFRPMTLPSTSRRMSAEILSNKCIIGTFSTSTSAENARMPLPLAR